MDRIQTFQQFLTTQSVQIPLWGFMFNIILAAILALILNFIYVKYGKSLSNRKNFAGNFILLATTTMLIISIVKSSLALSLGLVGALSIVRFRAAIKEPEELAYLFICIAIGLGLGADQSLITVVAFLFIIGVIIIGRISRKPTDDYNLHLTISTTNAGKEIFDRTIDIMKQDCASAKMRRMDQTQDIMEASFLIEFNNFEQFKKCRENLQRMDDSIKITFLDNKGII